MEGYPGGYPFFVVSRGLMAIYVVIGVITRMFCADTEYSIFRAVTGETAMGQLVPSSRCVKTGIDGRGDSVKPQAGFLGFHKIIEIFFKLMEIVY